MLYLFYHNKWKRLKVLELLSTENQKAVSGHKRALPWGVLGKTVTRVSHTDKFKPWDSPSVTCIFWPTPSYSFTPGSQITLFNPSDDTRIPKDLIIYTRCEERRSIPSQTHSNFKEKILINNLTGIHPIHIHIKFKNYHSPHCNLMTL